MLPVSNVVDEGAQLSLFLLTEEFAAFAVVKTHLEAGTVNEDCEHHISL